MWLRSGWSTPMWLSPSFCWTSAITMALVFSPSFSSIPWKRRFGRLEYCSRLSASASRVATFWSSSPICVLFLSILSRRDSIAFIYFYFSILSLSSFSTNLRTQLISFLIGRSSSSLALINEIAFFMSAMSSVAVADVERVCPLGIVRQFACGWLLSNLTRHGWMVRWLSGLGIP